ncbi:MAG: hypothetical protein ACMUJM_17645 [bacterium]
MLDIKFYNLLNLKKKVIACCILLFIFSLSLRGPAFCQEIPPQQSSPDTISMPWNTFLSLWDQAKEDDAQRKLEFSYEKALYTGSARIDKDDYFIHFQALIFVSTFKNNDTLVPFLSNQLNLESLSVNGHQSTWIEKEGFFQVYIPKQGLHEVSAKFTIVINNKSWPRSFFLPMVMSAKSEVILDVPDINVEAHFDKGVAKDTVLSEAGSRIQGYVPAVDGVTIRWLQKNEGKKKVPLKMGATVHTYLSLEEKGAYSQNEVTFHILQGETNFFTIHVPHIIDILEVNPVTQEGSISQWFTEDTENARLIHIYSSYQQKKEFKVQLIYEHTETKTTYRFSIPTLIPQSVERYENLIAVGSKANVEIQESSARMIERRDVRFLPQEIRQYAKSHALFYYKILGEDFHLEFNVKSHEKAETIKTAIESVEADSVMTEAGALMTKATYSIKNNQAQYLRLTLPENSKLLSAFLKGQEVQPAMDGRHLLIPISKSAENSFPVEIAYLTTTNKFGIFGRRSLYLPEINLSIGELSWKLYCPEAYQIFYFGGNIERKKYSLLTRIDWLLGQVSLATQNQACAGMNREKYDYSKKGLRRRFKSSLSSSESYLDEVMPGNQVQVQIPVTGSRYRFESYLIKGLTPRISFFYVNETIHNSIAMVATVIVFLFLIWTFALLFERSALPEPIKKIKNYLKGVGVVALLGFLLTIFSLGITSSLGKSVVFALFSFGLWQNRQVARRFHKKITGWKSYFPDVLLLGLLFLTMLSFIAGLYSFIVFIFALSIVFHGMFPLWQKITSSRKARKATAIKAVILLIVILSPLLLGMCSGSWAEDREASSLPKLPHAHVNLSWHVVEGLLKKIEQKKKIQQEELDLEYIFGNVNIKGNISERYAHLNLMVPLSILSDDYVKIPLLPSSIPVKDAFYNGKSLTLNEENGYILFEAKKESDKLGMLKMNLIVPVREKGGVQEFIIAAPLIRGGLVELTFGQEIKSILLHGVVWQEREGQKISAALGQSQQLHGELATFRRKKELADESSKRVKKIYSTTYTLLSLGEEVAMFYSSIRYRILNDQVRTFQIRLPHDVVVHEIVGEDLEEWGAQESDNGITTYTVKVLYPVGGKYDLSVHYEKAFDTNKMEFITPSLDVVGVARDVGYLGIEMQAQAEIFIKKLSKARLIDIQKLPDIIKEDAYSPLVYAIRYMERPYEISFEIVKHENFEMDAAIADRIQYTCVISPHGKFLAQVHIWIRNSRKQFASFILPQGAQVLSTFLDNMSVTPSLGKEGELLLPLKRQSVDPFIVDVVYEGPEINLNYLGGLVKLEFPHIDIPVSIVSADIYIPHHVYFSKLSGDLLEASVAGFVPWRQNHNQIFMDNQGFNYNDQLLNTNQIPQQNLAGQPKSSESLSLKIKLPTRGKKISLNTFYASEREKLHTRFFACHQSVYYLGYIIALILFIGTGYLIPLYTYVPRTRLMVCIIGISLLFYFIPFTWQEILFYLIIGLLLHYCVKIVKKKMIRSPLT